jgi:isoleucyl-tRNA synthetase
MGADVMRWLYAGQNLQTNLLFGYGPAEEVSRKLLTLWNVYSFFVGRAELAEFVPKAATNGHAPRLTRMDRWILSQLDALVALANDRLEAYDVASLVNATDRFVEDLSTWYVRRGRSRFSRGAASADQQAAFSTLHECLVTLARVVAPIMPFLAEEMYQNLVRSWDSEAADSIHLTPYPTSDGSRRNRELDQEMELARAVVTLGRSARSEAGLRVRQPLASITIAGEAADLRLSDELRSEIADELNVKSVLIADNVESFARRVVRPNLPALGPKLGKELGPVRQALQAGDFAVQADGSVTVAGRVLGPDEVLISLEPLENRSVAQDLRFRGGLAVALDQSVTAALRVDGRARVLVHRVQTMRREAGLSVEDRIKLAYAGSPAWDQVLGDHRVRVLAEVGAVDLEHGADGANPDLTWSGKLDDEEISLSLWRAGD